MILLLLLMLIARVAGVDAQSDITKLSVTYEVHYLNYAEDDSLSRDIAQLDIGTNTSRYYSKVSEWYDFNPVGKAPYPGTKIKNEEVYKNMPNKGLVTAMHWPYWITTQDSINHLFDWQWSRSILLFVDILATKLRPHFAVEPGLHGIHLIWHITMALGNYAVCLD